MVRSGFLGIEGRRLRCSGTAGGIPGEGWKIVRLMLSSTDGVQASRPLSQP